MNVTSIEIIYKPLIAVPLIVLMRGYFQIMPSALKKLNFRAYYFGLSERFMMLSEYLVRQDMP